ncbi:type II toxin-antitoxin system RelE/ParE family toxin [Enterobacter sp. Ap-1006]|uniref:type II toxin-antitoxin system RelE/ParE family toxin n=1 Tax=Enterobacter sp. Ap-1006 TaxID=2608345 RepID=UPI001423E144|nr:type II toxin-antitoxin system RelE/ParE family toxin [Enterobacter sp. Ap-1006]
MAYRLTEEAQRDIIEIRDYTITHWGTSQSKCYLQGLRKLFTRLAESPGIGQCRTAELGLDISSFPYSSHMVYYLNKAQGIEIVAVIHQSRAPERHLAKKM